MDLITIACVNVGTKYPPQYVDILHNSVERWLKTPFRFLVLTDNPKNYPNRDCVNVKSLGLPRWWSKMALFNPKIRGVGRMIFLDLDTVVCGDIGPLVAVESQFAICENFTRLRGNDTWPCLYGSCAMVMQEGWGLDIWNQFWNDRHYTMDECATTGDQMAIQLLHPHADFLQSLLPAGFFLHYKDIGSDQPKDASLVVFGGKSNPHNCEIKWVKDHWR